MCRAAAVDLRLNEASGGIVDALRQPCPEIGAERRGGAVIFGDLIGRVGVLQIERANVWAGYVRLWSQVIASPVHSINKISIILV